MDAVLFWNAVALEANKVSHTNGKDEQTGPTLSSRALAIVHLAMYDAYVGIAAPAGLPAYLTNPAIPAPGAPASVDAAIAAAAHATLSQLYPSQKAYFDAQHAQAGLSGAGLKAGHDYGRAVAKRLLDARKDDPPASDDGYAASVDRGAHRPDPSIRGQGYHAPFYGAGSRCFAATSRHPLGPPPAVSTAPGPYLSALREVRSKGIAPELMGLPVPGALRTIDETLIGIFWAYDGAVNLGTPPRFYNQIVRTVAITRGNTLAQNVELFALVNAAMGDAGILAWEEKYRYDLWRPVVGIREHDVSMGPTAVPRNNLNNDCDASWLPLGAPKTNSTLREKNFTPPFPAYPSGHATFGAAAFHITRLFYGVKPKNRKADTLLQDANGDDLAFESEELNGISWDNAGVIRPRHLRSFPDGLWQMIIENGQSRVYLGVHWIFDAFAVKGNTRMPDLNQNVGGVPLGLNIAEDIYANKLVASNAAEPTSSALPFSTTELSSRKPWPLA